MLGLCPPESQFLGLDDAENPRILQSTQSDGRRALAFENKSVGSKRGH
jgi:hypothetical protein